MPDSHEPDALSLPERLAAQYADQPIAQALVQLLCLANPVAAVTGIFANAALLHAGQKASSRRLEAFADELREQGFDPEQLVADENLLHACLLTTECALRTRREEKIRLFADLLANHARGVTDPDEFEEYLAILDDLSYREFRALCLLDHYQQTLIAEPGEEWIPYHKRLWSKFLEGLLGEIGVAKEEGFGFIGRLERTGLFQKHQGTGAEYMQNAGHITPLFGEFATALGVTTEERQGEGDGMA